MHSATHTPIRRTAICATGLLLFASGGLTLAAPPAEVGSLQWCAGSKDCLQWSAAAGATDYVVYSGTAADLPRLATGETDGCRVLSDATVSTGSLITSDPLPADGLQWFLVAARNAEGEGTVGNGTMGARQLDAWGECCNQRVFVDGFSGSDGDPWRSDWASLADSAATLDIQSGAGRFNPRLSTVGYSLARVAAPIGADGEVNVEASYTVRFDAINSQGVGFYVRQNGGYSIADNTAACGPAIAGQGYVLFIHGPFLGFYGMEFWREVAGDEQMMATSTPLALSDGVDFRVRFRVVQATPTTTFLAAKLWPQGDPEPAGWQITHLDSAPSLQGELGRGGIAVDAYYHQAGTCADAPPVHAYVDDIEVRRICNPMVSPPTPALVSGGYLWAEGPVWDGDRLLFSDVNADTVYELTPPAAIGTFRSPSGQADGLALDPNGDLLTCEIGNRRVSRTDGAGVVSEVVSEYQSLPLNAPNDLAVRADGTIYFSDPEHLIVGPREQPFLNLFRIPAGGGPLVAEWSGTPGADGPNGVALSPDQRLLYLTNTATGTVQTFDVAESGALALRAPLATGVPNPDGLCVDISGNVYVASGAGNLHVYTPTGDLLGTWTFPDWVTNCTFGGSDRRTLYVTVADEVWAIPMPLPGVPHSP